MKCNECKGDKMLHSPEVPLCEDCYQELFEDVKAMGVEPDFELENEVALITKTGTTVLTFENGSKIETMASNITTMGHGVHIVFPKAYKIDLDKELSDAELRSLMVVFLSEVTFYDNHKLFPLIKHLLKEV